QVTVQGFSGSAYTLTIMSDPSFISSAPAVNPPMSSTAAFQVLNASVTLGNITVITTNTVTYGVVASSAYVTISSVNVIDPNGNIANSGMSLGSYDTVSNSSVTVTSAHGFYLNGSSMTAVSYSSAQVKSTGFY